MLICGYVNLIIILLEFFKVGRGKYLGLLKMPVKLQQSSFRDRTPEFLNVAERLKKLFSSTQNGANSASKAEEQRFAVAMQSEFNKRASKIGFGIHQTSQKLSKLAKCK